MVCNNKTVIYIISSNFVELYIYRRQNFGRQSTNSSDSDETFGRNKECKERGVRLSISECNVELGEKKDYIKALN